MLGVCINTVTNLIEAKRFSPQDVIDVGLGGAHHYRIRREAVQVRQTASALLAAVPLPGNRSRGKAPASVIVPSLV